MIDASLPTALAGLADDLRAIRVRWCLVGGLAVGARAEPRTTRDIDVAVAVAGDSEAETVVTLLRNRGYVLDVVLEHKDRDRFLAARLWMPARLHSVRADVMFASTGIEPEIVAAAELLEVFPGVQIPLATVGHLLAMKVVALRKDRLQERPQDFGDIRELLRVSTAADRKLTRESLTLIVDRGFERGKDLLADWEEQLEDFQASQRENQP